MYSLILHGRRSIVLQKWSSLRFEVNLLLNESALSKSFFSTTTSAADVRSLQDGGKGENFTVSYLVDSLGLSTKLAESISKKVTFKEKANPDSVVSLLRSYDFTDSQIGDIITDYPRLLIADAEKSLAPKLQFLQSRGGASSSELTEIVSKVPKILGKRDGKTISVYYDIVKEIIEADKSSKFETLCHSSLPQGIRQENKIRNVLVLRELGVPQQVLFPLLDSDYPLVCGKGKFEESLKKIVEMGFDPKTSKFLEALRIVQRLSYKTLEEKVNFFKRLGFTVGEIWETFKKNPVFLTLSENKILISIETFQELGFTRDEFMVMVKCFPQCIAHSSEMVKTKIEFVVKQMNWPIKDVALFPQVLGYSMEKRIVPRCNVIKALMSKGLLGSKIPSIPSVLACTEQTFLNKYVMKHNDKELERELMAILTKDRAP